MEHFKQHKQRRNPNLIILQNVIQNDLALYSFGKYFKLMKKYIQFELIFD